MGDGQNEDLRVQFDRRLKLKSLGSTVTTDTGLLADRELDEAFALTEMVQDTFEESRIGSNKQYQLVPLLRQSIDSRQAGYEEVNDAESQDKRLPTSGKGFLDPNRNTDGRCA